MKWFSRDKHDNNDDSTQMEELSWRSTRDIRKRIDGVKYKNNAMWYP